MAKNTPKTPKERAPKSLPRKSGQTPEQRKRARWLAGLWAAKQPQHPRFERVQLPSGGYEDRELPPQPRATRKEFLAPSVHSIHPPFTMKGE